MTPTGPLAMIPDAPIAVPARVRELAAGRPLTAVWVNGLGGITFRDPGAAPGMRSAEGAGERFIKWAAAGAPAEDLAAEAERLAWARGHGAAVPAVLDVGADAQGAWLITRGIPAQSAVTPRWRRDPERAARGIGAGLRALHETLPVSACPYSWAVETRLPEFEARLARGEGPESWDRAFRGLSVAEARARLRDAPEPDRLVVCHGDACAPNTLLDAHGGFAAHVDLGALGVADRWADLAVAAWSTEWNYGPGFAHRVYEGYGIDPDPERIAYYRLLWDLS